jgi:hypothetical protein
MPKKAFKQPELAAMAAEISALRCALHALMHVNEHPEEAAVLFLKLAKQWHSAASIEAGSMDVVRFRDHSIAIQRQLTAKARTSRRH